MSEQREKRVIKPPSKLSPSDQFDRPSHFLLHFESTDSYNIALYSSIRNISGNKATVNIHGKKTVATIITSGTLECCETEQKKITRSSQQDPSEITQSKIFHTSKINDNDYILNDQQEDLVYGISSVNRPTTSHETPHVNLRLNEEDIDLSSDVDHDDKHEDIEVDDDDWIAYPTTTSKQKGQSNMNKTKRKQKQTVVTGNKPKRQRVDNTCDEPNKQKFLYSDLPNVNDTDPKDFLNRIENQMMLHQNMINKTLKRMERKFAFHCGNNYIQNSKILDQYRNEKGENFPSEYMYGSRNLLRIPAKDIVDFARRTLKILFSQEELKTHILPPEREHLRRPPLDQDRFNILLEAIRIKFRLDSVLMEQCFNDVLRTKLSNFLYEERRREFRRRIRCQERMSKIQQNLLQPIPYDNQENMDNQCVER